MDPLFSLEWAVCVSRGFGCLFPRSARFDANSDDGGTAIRERTYERTTRYGTGWDGMGRDGTERRTGRLSSWNGQNKTTLPVLSAFLPSFSHRMAADQHVAWRRYVVCVHYGMHRRWSLANRRYFPGLGMYTYTCVHFASKPVCHTPPPAPRVPHSLIYRSI